MKFLLNRLSVVIMALFALFPFVYIFILQGIEDPRIDDGGLDMYETRLWEVVVFTLAIISIVFGILCSSRYANKAGKKQRAFWSVMVWPISFYFLFKYGNDYIENH